MNKLSLISYLLILFTFQSYSFEVSDKLLIALSIVESNSDSKLIGDNGNSLGILQIQKICIDDVNRIYKTSYKHSDAFDPVNARTIAKLYLKFYCDFYEKKTKFKADDEIASRIWNGGPYGWSKNSTKKYWNKVKKHLTK